MTTTKTIDLEKLTKLATITLVVHPEDHDPLDSFGYDSDEENERAAQEVRDLAERTVWGWCWVKVTATYAGISCIDTLGACSYASEEEFKVPGGYYTDMVTVALASLASELEATDAALAEVRS